MLKKIFKKASVITITLALMGSILSITSQAEITNSTLSENKSITLKTGANLTAPPVFQSRLVNTNYSQMASPTVETFSNGDRTGYLNVSWLPVENATKYQVILFNGSIHSCWDVPADQTSWTTKGKGMFPTSEQIQTGQVNF